MKTKETFLTELKSRLDASGLSYEDLGGQIIVRNSESTPTVIQFEEINARGMDGRLLTHRVTVSKRCLKPAHGVLAPGFLSKWNTYTSIFAAIPGDDYVDVVARLNLYEGALDINKHIHAPLVYWATWLAPGIAAFLEDGEPNAVSFVKGAAPKVDPWWFGIPNDAALIEPPFTEDDLHEAKSYLRDCGLLSSIEYGGITVEFPWDKDAKGVLYDAFFDEADEGASVRTSLLMIELTAEHPLFGKGVLAQYRVPFTVKGEVSALVTQLNQWDYGNGDLPPFFGSWCKDPASNAPAYVFFIPSMLGRTVTLVSLLNWMGQRHKAVMAYLKSGGLAE